MTVQPGLCKTWLEPQIVGFVTQTLTIPGIFFSILGRGPRAFLIGKFSDVNLEFGKFSKHSKQCDIKVFHLESLKFNKNL